MRILAGAFLLVCAFPPTSFAQPPAGNPPRPPGLDFDKIRKSISAPSGDSASRTATHPIRLVPIRPVRVPGVTFALGDTLEGMVQRFGLTPDNSGNPGPNERVFAGEIRFYGQEAHARLHFTERWLSKAHIEADGMTESVRRYIVDDLVRQGYRRACTTFDAQRVDCTWSGRTIVDMVMDTTAILDVHLPVEPAAMVAAAPASPAPAGEIAGPGAPPETLTVEQATAVTRIPPAYPDQAREANVDGTVHVFALVDSTGAVRSTRVSRTDNTLLNDAAVAAVRQWSFEPHTRDGRAVSFWVEIPVKFSLH